MATNPITAKAKGRPYIRKQFSEAQCPECGQPFTPRRWDQVNCSTKCKDDGSNREAARAREVYRALYHWVLGNGKGHRGKLIGEVSRKARQWKHEDRAAGRRPPPIPELLATRAQNARIILAKGQDATGEALGLLQELGQAPR